MQEILIPTLIVGAIGAVLGLVLAISSSLFKVEVDPRLETVVSLLPGYNCGACGYAGCQGMAEGLLSKENNNVALCKPSNAKQRKEIVDYLANTPSPDGETLKIIGG